MKVANLIAIHPAPVMDYIFPPIGAGLKPPSPLKPLLAMPTTSGTGSEATAIAVLDLPEMKTKAAISHRSLCPSHGIVDPGRTTDLRFRGQIRSPTCGRARRWNTVAGISGGPWLTAKTSKPGQR